MSTKAEPARWKPQEDLAKKLVAIFDRRLLVEHAAIDGCAAKLLLIRRSLDDILFDSVGASEPQHPHLARLPNSVCAVLSLKERTGQSSIVRGLCSVPHPHGLSSKCEQAPRAGTANDCQRPQREGPGNLQVILRIPIAIKNDDGVSSRQIQPEACQHSHVTISECGCSTAARQLRRLALQTHQFRCAVPPALVLRMKMPKGLSGVLKISMSCARSSDFVLPSSRR
jgi:hypothetical protein